MKDYKLKQRNLRASHTLGKNLFVLQRPLVVQGYERETFFPLFKKQNVSSPEKDVATEGTVQPCRECVDLSG
jgi:hypothetical protein